MRDGLVRMVAGLALSVMVCGCASVNPVVKTQPAPVVHKLDDTLRYASLRTPATTVLPPDLRLRAAPVAPPAIPAPVPLPAPQGVPFAPEARSPAPEEQGDAVAFPESVDTDLYAHQRVGKRYTVRGKSYKPRHQPGYDKTGTASWYGKKFHGKLTASGERFDMHALTAAHRTLPFNSLVHVENVKTGVSLIVRINDRGPFAERRIIDLSKAAAKRLGIVQSGLQTVRVRYAGPADPNTTQPVVKQPNPSTEPEADTIVTQPAPEAVADASPEELYTPLRRLPDTERLAEIEPRTQLPPLNPALPQPPAPRLPGLEPLRQVAPQAPTPDGPATLTIKGPIHMAKSRSLPNPEYIRAAAHD